MRFEAQWQEHLDSKFESGMDSIHFHLTHGMWFESAKGLS
jgi:hypothetical protein